MNAPLKGEILPAEPVADASGEEKQWFNGKPGPGRPKGQQNTTTRELKDAIMRAFDDLGGHNYLLMLGVTRPDLFVGLLGKVLPLKVEPGEDQLVEYRVIRRVPMIPEK